MELSVIRAAPERWLALFLFSLVYGASGFVFVFISMVVSLQNQGLANTLNWVTELSSIALLVPCVVYVDKMGLKQTVQIAAGCVLLGAGVNVGGLLMPGLFVIGGLIGNIGTCLLACCPGKLSSTWFQPNWRVNSITVACVSTKIGTQVGNLITLTVYSSGDISPALLGLFGAVALCCAPCIVYPQEKNSIQGMPVIPELTVGDLLSNGSFVLVLAVSSMSTAGIPMAWVLMSNGFEEIPYREWNMFVPVWVMNLTSIVVSIVLSPVIVTYPKFRLSILALTSLGILGSVLLTVGLSLESLAFASVSGGLLGCVYPARILSIALALTLVHGGKEGLVTGALALGGAVAALVGSLIVQFMAVTGLVGGVILVVWMAVAGGVAIAVKGENARAGNEEVSMVRDGGMHPRVDVRRLI